MPKNSVWLAAVSLAAVLATGSASAADWPEVKTSAKSPVPACATPGRLMALVKARNNQLDTRFDTLAVDYMRQGEALGMRWDYAFFQMLVETNNLTFKKGVRGGSVTANQNNLAGLGAVGGSEAGESFKDIATGVRAHLEHVLIYAGQKVDAPVAERTRKVQEWGTLTSFHQGLKAPATYTDVMQKWAPKSKDYTTALSEAADAFYNEHCKKTDPKPELVAAARGGMQAKPQVIAEAKPAAVIKPEPVAAPALTPVATPAAIGDKVEKPSGVEIAKKAVEDGKAEGNNLRAGLGAGLAARSKQAPTVKMLNAPEAPAFDQDPAPAVAPIVSAQPPASVQKTAAAAAAAVKPTTAPKVEAANPQKCRVWTASYGGEKALIIKSTSEGMTNYTVLDVNGGQEEREADAYIAAYAKGGKIEAQFTSQGLALDKAFDLCPEG
jgi:Mannosyl-glycoprotein endo-beta-N-acetylglucosaminidase